MSTRGRDQAEEGPDPDRLGDVGANTKCPVLQQAQCYRTAMGENKGESSFLAWFIMNTTESADQVKAIIDGLKATAALRAASDAEGAALIDALKVTATTRRW